MRHLLSTLLLTLIAIAAVAQRSGKDYAVFFVVTDFDHWADLPGIDKDLREIAAELEANYGFQKPDFYLNPKKADILRILTEYQTRSFGPDDQLLVFCSMHGYYDEAIGALIPKDGLLDDPAYQTWLLHPALEAMLTKIKCEHVLLALDACYSGTFGQKYKDRPGAPAYALEAVDCASKSKRALQHKSRLYLTSGGKERTPAQSQFAKKWLEALRLRNQDGFLGFHKLYAVLGEAFPQPMYGDFKDHVVGGDFVFLRKNACGTAHPTPENNTAFDPEEQVWKIAQRQKNGQIYLDEYPNGKYAVQARQLKATEANTADNPVKTEPEARQLSQKSKVGPKERREDMPIETPSSGAKGKTQAQKKPAASESSAITLEGSTWYLEETRGMAIAMNLTFGFDGTATFRQAQNGPISGTFKWFGTPENITIEGPFGAGGTIKLNGDISARLLNYVVDGGSSTQTGQYKLVKVQSKR